MPLPQVDNSKLSVEGRTRLDVFYRRFCEGRLRRQYGLGHLLYACHASFPLVLSAELANLIYINFNHYAFQLDPAKEKGGQNDATGRIDAIAVSDFLFSPLCRQIGSKQYEVYPEIRSYLLHLLKDGNWFKRYGIALNGAERLQDLAGFLEQYVQVRLPEDAYDGTGFRKLNLWAAQAYLNPSELANSIAEALEKSQADRQGQLWLNTQMERIEKQFNLGIHNHGGSNEVLRPFFNLFYYSEARKNEIFKKGESKIAESALAIQSILSADGKTRVIKLPLTKAIADRTNRKLNKVQRVVSLLIGIDAYGAAALKGSVYGANQMAELLRFLDGSEAVSGKGGGFDTGTVITLLNEAATKQGILSAVHHLFSTANAEDICLVYFSGHGTNESYHENLMVPVDYGGEADKMQAITNEEFFEVLYKGQSTCQTVMIHDSHSGYYKWVGEDDVYLGSVRHTTQTERPFDGKNSASAFLLAFVEIIRQTKGKITYRHLLLWLRFKVRYQFGLKEEVPVLMASPDNDCRFFLRPPTDRAEDVPPLIAYNKAADRWQVLTEDFELPSLNLTTAIREYETNEKVQDAAGEIFVSDDGVLFGGRTESLNKEALYFAEAAKPLLPVYCAGNGPDGEGIKKIVVDLKLDSFLKWRALKYFPKEDGTLFNDAERLVIDDLDEGYSLSFQSMDNKSEKANVRNVKVREASLLKDAIHKFARYHYLCNLRLPQEFYEIYEPLSLRFSYQWKSNAIKGNLHFDEPLTVSEESFFISGGSIQFHPLELLIENNEAFPVFCSICVLSSNLAIKKITPAPNPIMPKTTATVIMDEPKFFETLLSGHLNGQIKLLASRDPVQIDFSQTVIQELLTR